MYQIAVPWLTWLFVLFAMQVGAVIVGLMIWDRFLSRRR